MTDHLEQLYKLPAAAFLQPSSYLQGVIFSVAAAPEIPLPPVWFPWVFQHHGQLPNDKSLDDLADQLMACLTSALDVQRQPDKPLLPENCVFGQDPNSPLAQWLGGLLFSHQQLEPIWQQAWQRGLQQQPQAMPELQRQLAHCITMFSTFANVPLAVQQAREKGNGALEQKLPQIYLSLPKTLRQYVDLSGKMIEFLPDQFEQFEGK